MIFHLLYHNNVNLRFIRVLNNIELFENIRKNRSISSEISDESFLIPLGPCCLIMNTCASHRTDSVKEKARALDIELVFVNMKSDIIKDLNPSCNLNDEFAVMDTCEEYIKKMSGRGCAPGDFQMLSMKMWEAVRGFNKVPANPATDGVFLARPMAQINGHVRMVLNTVFIH